MINIKGLDKAQLLVELYNHSHQQGLGMMQPSRSLTIEDAKQLLEQTTYFDYLYGKVMKVDLSSDEEFEERLYDRDNGQGMAQSVVDGMRKELEKAATDVVEKSAKLDQEPQIDPRTKFVVGSEEYNNYYFPKIDKKDLYYDNPPIPKKDIYLDPAPIDKKEIYLDPKPINNYIEKKPINNYIEKKPINSIDGIDPKMNLYNKDMPKTIDLPVDVTDTYMGVYKQRITDDEGRLSEVVKVGLFKKDKVYSPKGRKPVQSYVDILSGNTAGLLLYEDGKDIIASKVIDNVDLLSADYSVSYYSSIMQKIEEQDGIIPFTSEFVGLGLMRMDQVAPKLQGNVPLSAVLQELAVFSKLNASVDKRIADPRSQASINASLKDAEKNAINLLPLNDIDLSNLPEDFNTIKHR